MSLTNFQIIFQLRINLIDLIVLVENVVDLFGTLSNVALHSAQAELLLVALLAEGF
jgi:hypothetical protein